MTDTVTVHLKPDPGRYACRKIELVDPDGVVVGVYDVVPGEWNSFTVESYTPAYRFRMIPTEANRTT